MLLLFVVALDKGTTIACEPHLDIKGILEALNTAY
jgi:hypothetical protein